MFQPKYKSDGDDEYDPADDKSLRDFSAGEANKIEKRMISEIGGSLKWRSSQIKIEQYIKLFSLYGLEVPKDYLGVSEITRVKYSGSETGKKELWSTTLPKYILQIDLFVHLDTEKLRSTKKEVSAKNQIIREETKINNKSIAYLVNNKFFTPTFFNMLEFVKTGVTRVKFFKEFGQELVELYFNHMQKKINPTGVLSYDTWWKSAFTSIIYFFKRKNKYNFSKKIKNLRPGKERNNRIKTFYSDLRQEVRRELVTAIVNPKTAHIWNNFSSGAYAQAERESGKQRVHKTKLDFNKDMVYSIEHRNEGIPPPFFSYFSKMYDASIRLVTPWLNGAKAQRRFERLKRVAQVNDNDEEDDDELREMFAWDNLWRKPGDWTRYVGISLYPKDSARKKKDRPIIGVIPITTTSYFYVPLIPIRRPANNMFIFHDEAEFLENTELDHFSFVETITEDLNPVEWGSFADNMIIDWNPTNLKKLGHYDTYWPFGKYKKVSKSIIDIPLSEQRVQYRQREQPRQIEPIQTEQPRSQPLSEQRVQYRQREQPRQIEPIQTEQPRSQPLSEQRVQYRQREQPRQIEPIQTEQPRSQPLSEQRVQYSQREPSRPREKPRQLEPSRQREKPIQRVQPSQREQQIIRKEQEELKRVRAQLLLLQKKGRIKYTGTQKDEVSSKRTGKRSRVKAPKKKSRKVPKKDVQRFQLKGLFNRDGYRKKVTKHIYRGVELTPTKLDIELDRFYEYLTIGKASEEPSDLVPNPPKFKPTPDGYIDHHLSNYVVEPPKKKQKRRPKFNPTTDLDIGQDRSTFVDKNDDDDDEEEQILIKGFDSYDDRPPKKKQEYELNSKFKPNLRDDTKTGMSKLRELKKKSPSKELMDKYDQPIILYLEGKIPGTREQVVACALWYGWSEINKNIDYVNHRFDLHKKRIRGE